MAVRTARRLVLLGALALAGVAAHSASALAVEPCATAAETCVVTPSASDPVWTTVPPSRTD
jgi:ABC-type sugar transport system substrate-binding protein